MNTNTQYEPLQVGFFSEQAYYLPKRNIIFYVRGESEEKCLVGHEVRNTYLMFQETRCHFPETLAEKIQEAVQKRKYLFTKLCHDVEIVIRDIEQLERENAVNFKKFIEGLSPVSCVEIYLNQYGTNLSHQSNNLGP